MAGPWDNYAPQSTDVKTDQQSGPWNGFGQAEQAPAAQPGMVPGLGVPDPTAGPIVPGGLAGGLGRVDDMMRTVANGATFGAADTMAAGMQQLTGAPEAMGGPADWQGQQDLSKQALGEMGPIAGPAATMAGSALTSAIVPQSAFATLGNAIKTGGAMGALGTLAQSYFDDGTMPSPMEVAVGTIVGAGGAAIGNVVGGAIQKPKVNPLAEKYAGVLTNEGIDVTAGQVANDARMMRREAAATGAPDFLTKQAEAYSTAALRKAGILNPLGGRLEPQVLDVGFKNIGGKMDVLAAHSTIDGPTAKPLLHQLWRDTYMVAKDFGDSINGPTAKVINNTVKKVAKAAQAGKLDGSAYQDITSGLESAARHNSTLAPVLRELRANVDGAMENFFQQTNPAMAGSWKEARRLYSNLLVIQRASKGVNGDTAGGLITPKALAAATAAVKGAKAYTRGWTDFDGLAHAGAALIKPLPVATHASTDQISRALTKKLGLAGMGAGAGNLMGGGLPGMAVGAGVGAVADTGIDAIVNAIRMQPFSKLSSTASATGGQIGAAGGMAGGALANANGNPFAKALGQ